MKVLITGCTPRHVGSRKLLRQYMHGSPVLAEALRAAGHEVVVAPVGVEDRDVASRYDVALVGISPPLTFVSTWLLGALHALREFGPRAALWCDDWSVENFRSHARTTCKNPSKYLFGRFKRPGEREALGLDEAAYGSLCADKGRSVPDRLTAPWVETLRSVAEGPPRPLLAWFHGWGRPDLWAERCRLPHRVTPWDPTTFIAARPHLAVGVGERQYAWPLDTAPKERAWCAASLQDVSKWLGDAKLTWPVRRFGNARQGNQVLKEHQVVDQYFGSWGVLCPSYNRARGTGWWRARYLHAAMAGCVLYSTPGEGGGPAYDLDLAGVEAADDHQLSALAWQQRESLFAQSWCEGRMLDTLDCFLKGLTA